MGFVFSAFADESDEKLTGQIDALIRNGYTHLEIRNLDGKNVSDLSVNEAREISKILSDSELKVWSIGSPIGKIEITDDFESHLDKYKQTLEIANILGADRIRLFSFFMPRGENPENYKNLVIDRMGAFSEIAKEYSVIPCHENEKGIYGDIATRCAEIHKALPYIKAVFDPANFIQAGQDTLGAFELLGRYVDYMHIKDALKNGEVVPAGKGVGNVPQLIGKYKNSGGRVLTLEPHLYEFVGLKNLEREGEESIVGGCSFETPKEAFDAAVNALKGIVNTL